MLRERNMAVKIHPTAEVQSDRIGDGTVVWQNSVILKGAVIGENCNINCHVFIEDRVTIGSFVTIKPGVQIWNETTLDDYVFVGPNATFTNDVYPRSKQYPQNFPITRVKTGASIGGNSTILPGVSIGEYALIGAGSVVTRDVPCFTLWYGNPARHRGYVTREGLPLNRDLMDDRGRRYLLVEGEPIISTEED